MRRVLFWIYWLLTRALALLPLDVVFGVGYAAGWLGWWLTPPYRRLVLRNLEIAFGGELTQAQRRRLGRTHFARLGANLLAGAKMALMPVAAVAARVRVERPDLVEAWFRGGRGVVGAINHLGNWELFSMMPVLFPRHRFGTVYQRLGNRAIDADVRRTRGRGGVVTFDRAAGFKAPVRFLEDGGGLAILIDQHAGDGGIWTPLFGRLASTSPLAATLAIRAGVDLVPSAMVTDGWARWRFVIEPPLDLADGDVERATAELNQALERQIRRSPADWFWVHNRWKTPAPNFLLAAYKRGVRLPPGMAADDLKPFRILVRSSNWLGDAAMSAPAVAALKAGRPDARIAVLCRAKLADFWAQAAGVDEVTAVAPGEGVWRVARKIAGRFDAAVIFPNSFRSALEVFLAGIPRRVGRPGHRRAWLFNQVFRPKKKKPGPPRHQVHDYLDLAEFVGATVDREAVVRGPLTRRGPWLRGGMVGVAGGATGEGSGAGALVGTAETSVPIIGICPGAEFGPAKRWPAERFARAAQRVGERRRVRWVLFGTAADTAAAGPLLAALGDRCENRIGRTTVAELIAGLAGCAGLLTNDTGTMHLAAYLGVPTVAVFGSTEQRLTGPLGAAQVVVRNHVACSPCFRRTCPLDFRCLLGVEPETVAAALERLVFGG